MKGSYAEQQEQFEKVKMNMKHYTRHKIEDLLQEEGFEIIGGGQSASEIGSDGSGTDISFEK